MTEKKSKKRGAHHEPSLDHPERIRRHRAARAREHSGQNMHRPRMLARVWVISLGLRSGIHHRALDRLEWVVLREASLDTVIYSKVYGPSRQVAHYSRSQPAV
jgi:hypothetical protein